MSNRTALEAFSLDGPDGASASRGAPMLPWSLLGMGALIAWLCCTHLPGMFAADLAGADAVDYLMRVGDIGAFVAVALAGRRLGPLSGRPRLCGSMVALCSLCTLALPLLAASQGPAAAAALPAASVVGGAGGAVLFLLWAEAYGQLGPGRTVFYGSASCIAAGALALAVSGMEPAAANVAIALLPAVSGLSAAVSLSRLPGERRPGWGASSRSGAAAGEGRMRYPVPWKLVCLMALAGFASGFAGALILDADGMGARHRIAATAAFGALLLVAFVARRGRFDIRVLAWSTLPLAVTSLCLIPFLGATQGAVLSFLVKFSYVSFALFVLLVLANVVWRFEVPSARVFASARAASEAAMLAGILLRRWMREAGVLDNGATLWLIALIGLAAVVGCVVVWHSERSVTSDWGATGVDASSGLRVPSRRELVRVRCEELAGRCGLTPREREVLELVAEGLEPSQIEQTLFLSHNTLKTHLRHIYAKLGVHTREEAAELAGVSA